MRDFADKIHEMQNDLIGSIFTTLKEVGIDGERERFIAG